MQRSCDRWRKYPKGVEILVLRYDNNEKLTRILSNFTAIQCSICALDRNKAQITWKHIASVKPLIVLRNLKCIWWNFLNKSLSGFNLSAVIGHDFSVICLNMWKIFIRIFIPTKNAHFRILNILSTIVLFFDRSKEKWKKNDVCFMFRMREWCKSTQNVQTCCYRCNNKLRFTF